ARGVMNQSSGICPQVFVNRFERTRAELRTHWMSIDDRVFDDQIVVRRQQWNKGVQLAQYMLSGVIRIQDDQHAVPSFGGNESADPGYCIRRRTIAKHQPNFWVRACKRMQHVVRYIHADHQSSSPGGLKQVPEIKSGSSVQGT